MTEKDLPFGAMRDRIQEAVAWTRNGRYEDAIEVFEAYLAKLSAEGELTDKRFAASAFSYYGLCVAMVKHKYAEALQYCNVSLKSNFLDPEHRINLALVYLERDDRKNAVRNLEAGYGPRITPSQIVDLVPNVHLMNEFVAATQETVPTQTAGSKMPRRDIVP